MKKIILLVVLVVSSVVSEPPIGVGGGGYGGGGGDNGNEGQIPGAIVDQALLDRITDILNQQEKQGGGYASPQSSYGAPPSNSYGAPPSSGYGAPSSGGKIELGKVAQGILVSNFVEKGQDQGGYGGGQSSGGYGRRRR